MTLSRGDLRGYQRAIVDKIKQCVDPDPAVRLPGIIAALQPGAGKTGTVLIALDDLFKAGRIRKTLIVAPLLVAQTVWPEEPAEWDCLDDLTMTLIRVEEDDETVTRETAEAYALALERYQAQFAADVAEMVDLGMKPAAAQKATRAAWEARVRATFTPEDIRKKRAVKATPGDLAETERQAAYARSKDAALARLAAQDTQIHIINKEAIGWLWDHFGDGARWPYDVIVCDDLREGRSGKRRVKPAKGALAKGPAGLSRWGVLARARGKVKTLIQLTGTPTPKGLENMWGLVYLIDRGKRLKESKSKFLDTWFNVNKWTHEVTPRPAAFEDIMALVQDIVFSINPEDLPDLPPFILDPIKVKLPAKVLAEYRRFEADMVSAEHDVEAVNRGVLHGKLLQFANGSMFQEDGNDVPIHDGKIDALRTLVERLDGQPLLVAYTYTFDVTRILKEFPKAMLLRPENAVETKRRWNAGQIEILLAHRASAGHGLNLQKGGQHICEYGLTSDAELYEQFRKRLHRPGQTGPVWNHVIIAEGTIDEQVYPMYLDPKLQEQSRILGAVELDLTEYRDTIDPTAVLLWALAA